MADNFEEGWCSEDKTCYYHYGFYNPSMTSDEQFFDLIDSGNYCYIGTSSGVGYYGLLFSIYIDGIESEKPENPEYQEFLDLADVTFGAGNVSYRASYPYYFRVEIQNSKPGTYIWTDRYIYECTATSTNDPDGINGYWTGTNWRFTAQVWSNQTFDIYKAIVDWECPYCYDKINGICVFDENNPDCKKLVECTPQITTFYCGDTVPDGIVIDTPVIIDEIDYSCCDYAPKDFITWSYGLNMKVLVPPNKR